MGKQSRIKAQRRAQRQKQKSMPPPRKELPWKKWLGGALLLLIVVGFIFFIIDIRHNMSDHKKEMANQPKALAADIDSKGEQIDSPPWVAEHKYLSERLDRLGLAKLKVEGSVLHTHQHIDIYINGQSVQVPPFIGIAEDDSFISPLHTHDDRGIIHVESPTKRNFTLGEFFGVWGVSFDADHIGTYKSPVSVYVNGKLYKDDPTKLKLENHQELVVVSGQKPSQLPDNFDFKSLNL